MSKAQELLAAIRRREARAIARAISLVEDRLDGVADLLAALDETDFAAAIVLGVTGPPGGGKSTLTDQLVAFHRRQGRRVGVVAVDPSSPHTGGALLGDRIRMMRHATDPEVIVRSMATRGRLGGLCAAASAAARIMACSGCEVVFLETVGVGQTEMDVARVADLTLLVLAPGLGDDIQAMKAGLAEMADLIVVNKADRPGADELAAEMEVVAHERACPVCRTCATDGQGVEALAAAVERLTNARRESGELAARRDRAAAAEVLDWAMELVRPPLAARLAQAGPLTGDRRAIAQRLVSELCAGGKPPPPR